MAKAVKLPENPTPEQVEKLKKPLVKSILSEFYTDGIDDLTVEDGDGANVIAQGQFLDRRITGGAVDNRIFEYEIIVSGTEYIVNYQPISGNFSEPEGWIDDEAKMIQYARTRTPVSLEFAEGQPITEEWIADYRRSVQEQLAVELEEMDMGYLVFEEPDTNEPSWAQTPRASWAQKPLR